MIVLKLLAILIINLILVGSILPNFSFLGSIPNPSLAIIVSLGLIRGKFHGAFFGLILGLLEDILFSRLIGVKALIYFFIGYSNGLIRESLNQDNKFLPVFLTGIATIVFNAGYYLLMIFLAKEIPSYIALKKIISLEILYNSILTIFIYHILSKIIPITDLRFTRR